MAVALLAHEIALLMAAKLGIPAEYIDVYSDGSGWNASFKAPAPIWAMEKQANVKNLARQFQTLYSLKSAAA